MPLSVRLLLDSEVVQTFAIGFYVSNQEIRFCTSTKTEDKLLIIFPKR